MGTGAAKGLLTVQKKGAGMFWAMNSSDGKVGRKQVVTVNYEREEDKDDVISDLKHYPFDLKFAGGNSELRLYMTLEEFDSMIRQGCLLLMEADRKRLENL